MSDKDTHVPGLTERFETAFSMVLYSACSISMILLNKLLLHTYNLNYPIGLLVIQNGGALILCCLGKYFGWIHYPDMSLETIKKWVPLTILFVMMLWTSMLSLHTMSVAAQTILKSTAVPITAMGDHFFLGKHVSAAMYLSFLGIFAGGYLGSKGDPWVTPLGIFYTLANVVFTAAYMLYMKVLLSDVSKKIGKYGPVFYNNLLSLPIFLVIGAPSFGPMLVDIRQAEPAAKVLLVCMAALGSAISFAVFWCMSHSSPTSFGVVGALNKVPLTFLGMLIFQQFPTPVGYLGICVALLSGTFYTYLNLPKPASPVVPVVPGQTTAIQMPFPEKRVE